MQSQDIAEDKLLTFARNIIDLRPKDMDDLQARIHDVLLSGLKYQKGDFVYFFDTELWPSIDKCEVLRLQLDENKHAKYYVATVAGRTIGWVREELLFKTKAELVEYYEAVLHR